MRLLALTAILGLTLLVGQGTPVFADFDAGSAAYKRGDWDAALREARPLADQGDRRAQYLLGLIHDKGRGVPEDDAKAVHWYQSAAEQGHTTAQYALGAMYSNGRDVPRDDEQAVHWFRLAAEQGDAKAQLRLGVKYYAGKGVRQNYTLTHMWYTLAADQGSLVATRFLDQIAALMSPEEITEARRRADAWRPKSWGELAGER